MESCLFLSDLLTGHEPWTVSKYDPSAGMATKRHKGHKSRVFVLCPLCLFAANPPLVDR